MAYNLAERAGRTGGTADYAESRERRSKHGKTVLSYHDSNIKRSDYALLASPTAWLNDKIIAFGLQAHNFNSGIMETYKGDRGGAVRERQHR